MFNVIEGKILVFVFSRHPHPDRPKMFMPTAIISSLIFKTLHIEIIRDYNHLFLSLFFIQVIIFAKLLDAYYHSE